MCFSEKGQRFSTSESALLSQKKLCAAELFFFFFKGQPHFQHLVVLCKNKGYTQGGEENKSGAPSAWFGNTCEMDESGMMIREEMELQEKVCERRREH